MSLTVCLSADTLGYAHAGGHLWVYLNWALGLRACGCKVFWLEGLYPGTNEDQAREWITALKSRLEPYGLADCLAICSRTTDPLRHDAAPDCLDLDAAAEADLLINLRYATQADVVGRFRRSALIDIDPGLLQCWMSAGKINVAPHDAFFTIGETVGQPGARFPDAGLQWEYTPPCVALDRWQPHGAPADAAFTTVSHWYMDEWEQDNGEVYANDKRDGFLPFLDLPARTSQRLELALCLAGNEQERTALEGRGWSVREAHEVTSTPDDYQDYIRASRGEFSCVKPSCVRRQNAWISDRTLCYLASAKPAVVQHTGPSRFLPDAAGLFRFCDLSEAVSSLEKVATDYERHCRLARQLAEEFFDARKIVRSVLERGIG
jgi:hypothetical protein